ncbi:Alpha/Beta hydrolase protein [Amylocystis lapponica]|nr:Alpha/Beta hydrolase protein [Amylocystis lapponica]
MDFVASLQEREIMQILEPTINVFQPRLEAHRAEILSANRKTFKYGTTSDRQELDVYYPPEGAEPVGGKYPVLFFLYGGGFFSGAKVYPAPNDLGYINLGAFFSKLGFITVIPDYRICPEAKFPDPEADMRDAMAWIVGHPGEVVGGGAVPPDLDRLFVMGSSAGAILLTTLLLHPTLLPPDLRARIRGVVLQSGSYDATPERPALPPPTLMALFGSWEGVAANMPYGLLKRAPDTLLDGFPDVLVQNAEKEPDDVFALHKLFVPQLEARLGREIECLEMKDHNHISPHWALGTGEGEQWALDVSQWIKAKLVSK